MKCAGSVWCLLSLLALVWPSGILRAAEPQGSMSETKVMFLSDGASQGAPLQRAISEAGVERAKFDGSFLGDAGIVVAPLGGPERPSSPLQPQMETLLKKGGSVIFYVPDKFAGVPPYYKTYTLDSIFPVNYWSFQNARLARLSTGALAPDGTPFSSVLKTPGFVLPARYDLHLPYSTIEAGQHRYDWERLGKALLNTDWKVLLTTDQDGKLPLLVEGRCYAGHVLFFGGNLFAPELQAWSGYPAFMRELLNRAHPCRVSAGSPDVDELRLSIAPRQLGGPLQVEVTNPTNRPVAAVVYVKVRNLMYSLMNSVSMEVSVPAGKTISVSVPEAAAELQSGGVAREGDESLAFRRVEAGIGSLARQGIASKVSALVDRTPELTMAIEGEDVRKFGKTDNWPAGGVGMTDGTGMPLDRFVYFTGETPKVTVHLRHALHNIAPLAKATDLGWPENPSTQGINDGACDYGSVRGAFDVFGYWSGKSAETQQLRLEWPMPVFVAGERLLAQSDYRKWNRSNPVNYRVTAGVEGKNPVALAQVENAAYEYSRREDVFKPQIVKSCDLEITGLDPAKKCEPMAFDKKEKGEASNCSLGEWEVYGWPGDTLPKAVAGKLTVTVLDLSDGKQCVVMEKDVTAEALKDIATEIEVPTRTAFGEVRVTASFQPGDKQSEAVVADLPILFVPAGRDHIISRDELGEYQPGYLCSPGFRASNPFGLGDEHDTQGWGGPDDKAWAWSHDLMEVGLRSSESAKSFLESPAVMTHYTDPWHDFPSGRYVFDWVTDNFIDRLTTGDLKGKKSIHLGLADRWNGIPIGSSFTWADFIRFDEYLRAQGKPGLKGRTRREIAKEIVTSYGDQYQRFSLTRYADALLNSQKRLAALGVKFTVETHGSFPLAGGELGEKLAQADTAVGTDLFWELRDEDLFKSIGYRFGVVAANPDLESGAYNQWGWVSAALQNRTWFSTSGEVEPSRRQWYAAYWAGRVTSEGRFKPYTVYGFSRQGSEGVKTTLDDWTYYNRVQSLAVWVRPEEPAGFGMVASWQLQENRMSPNTASMGFGLHTGDGYDQMNELVGELYQRVVKNGVPVSFVASTHTLKQWNGKQPLIVADGFETDPWEIAELDRLNRGGAPIIAVGSENREGRGAAEAFFGVAKDAQGWHARAGTQVVNDAAGVPFAFVCKRANRPPVVFCPANIKSINGQQSKLLGDLCLEASGNPLAVTPGICPTAFVSNGRLFLNLCSQSDSGTRIDVAVRPGLLADKMTGSQFLVTDIDRAAVVPSRWGGNGALHFQISCGANDGRMIQIQPVAATSNSN